MTPQLSAPDDPGHRLTADDNLDRREHVKTPGLQYLCNTSAYVFVEIQPRIDRSFTGRGEPVGIRLASLCALISAE
jgi:hypothetical protein